MGLIETCVLFEILIQIEGMKCKIQVQILSYRALNQENLCHNKTIDSKLLQKDFKVCVLRLVSAIFTLIFDLASVGIILRHVS